MTTSAQDTKWLEQVETLFLRFGIKSITMDDVARELGISKKTLYQMVESKDALVIKVLSHHISREKTQCHCLVNESSNAIEEIFNIMDSNSQELGQMKTNIINDLQKYHRDAWLMIRNFQHEFVLKVIHENLTRGRKEGLYRDDFNVDIVAKLHLSTAFNLFDEQLFPSASTSKVVLFKEYMMHFLHGIVSAKGLAYLKKKLS
ncbi:MAG TPA: TetR/AcrR family transcriptional regulator [Saprospiraceae bacterium]|nr:TetR/AcrR family transcriptional regulator [Saprospiraceae bacterium]